MIGKILGAVVGAKTAEHARGIGGPGGALLGAGAVAVARRLGPIGLLAAAAGGYWLKKRNDAAEAAKTGRPAKGKNSAKAKRAEKASPA